MTLLGMEVHESHFAMVTVWEFPKDRFVEYGPEDEWWARKVGFGREVSRPGAIRIGDTWFVHPKVFEQLRTRFTTDARPLPLRWYPAGQ